MANTLKFFAAPFDGEVRENVNTIWSFTIGSLTKEGWDSEKVSNFEELRKKIKSKAEINKKLLIAMPTFGNRIINFNLDAKPKQERLVIGVFDGKTRLNPITFFGIEVEDGTSYTSKEYSANFKVYPVKIDTVSV